MDEYELDSRAFKETCAQHQQTNKNNQNKLVILFQIIETRRSGDDESKEGISILNEDIECVAAARIGSNNQVTY